MYGTSVLEDDPRPGGTSLDCSGFAGLGEDDARRNIEQDGPDELASQEKRGLHLSLRGALGDLAGGSPAMQRIFSLIRQSRSSSAAALPARPAAHERIGSKAGL